MHRRRTAFCDAKMRGKLIRAEATNVIITCCSVKLDEDVFSDPYCLRSDGSDCRS